MTFEMTQDEARILYEFLEHEYIPYQNVELMILIRRLRDFITKLDNEVKQDVVPDSEQL